MNAAWRQKSKSKDEGQFAAFLRSRVNVWNVFLPDVYLAACLLAALITASVPEVATATPKKLVDCQDFLVQRQREWLEVGQSAFEYLQDQDLMLVNFSKVAGSRLEDFFGPNLFLPDVDITMADREDRRGLRIQSDAASVDQFYPLGAGELVSKVEGPIGVSADKESKDRHVFAVYPLATSGEMVLVVPLNPDPEKIYTNKIYVSSRYSLDCPPPLETDEVWFNVHGEVICLTTLATLVAPSGHGRERLDF